jgi:hypothetical protein
MDDLPSSSPAAAIGVFTTEMESALRRNRTFTVPVLLF